VKKGNGVKPEVLKDEKAIPQSAPKKTATKIKGRKDY
jgi:hypothetical protein